MHLLEIIDTEKFFMQSDEQILELVKNNPNLLQQYTYHGYSLIHLIIKKKKASLLQKILRAFRNEIDINIKTIETAATASTTPLLLATPDVDMMASLLECDADPAISNENNLIPLARAVLNKSVEAVKIILRGYDPSSEINSLVNLKRNKTQATPLHCAAYHLSPEIIQLLLSISNIDVNTLDDKHNTPIIIATRNNSIEVILALLSHPQIDLTIKNKDGKTALTIADQLGHIESKKILYTFQVLKLLCQNKIPQNIKINLLASLEETVFNRLCEILGTQFPSKIEYGKWILQHIRSYQSSETYQLAFTNWNEEVEKKASTLFQLVYNADVSWTIYYRWTKAIRDQAFSALIAHLPASPQQKVTMLKAATVLPLFNLHRGISLGPTNSVQRIQALSDEIVKFPPPKRLSSS